MSKIFVIHGPNLNLLGIREKSIYGEINLEKINENMNILAKKNDIEMLFFQSNYEGQIVEYIHEHGRTHDLLIINPGAFTHTSIAIRDAILGVNIPVVEVHISNVYKREAFRHFSYIRDIAIGQITGFGAESYYLALKAGISLIKNGGLK